MLVAGCVSPSERHPVPPRPQYPAWDDARRWFQTLAFNAALAVGSFLAGVIATILLG